MKLSLENKKILVIGLASSGLAAIKLMHHFGANDITLTERKEIKDFEGLEKLGVKFVKQSDEVFNEHYDLVIKNPGVPPVSPFLKTLKDNGALIITEMELAYHFIKPQHLFAITGSNGKTTATTILYKLLKGQYGDKALVGGNIGTPFCDLVMQHHLYEECGYYIALEISNAQLVDIVDFKANYATITNLSPDHIDFMGGLDNYYLSKTRIYENMRKGDLFLINKDDELLAKYLKRVPLHSDYLTFSTLNDDADIYWKDEYLYLNDEVILAKNDVKVPGRHNLENIMIACTMAYKAKVDKDVIEEVISSFKGVEHRIEFVRELDGVRYYNDSKGTNTDATITALKAFDKNVILLVGGYEKGLSMDELKKYLKPVKAVIGFGDSGDRIAHELFNEQAIVCHDLEEAMKEVNKIKKNGDIVLLSPTTSSFDQYSCFEERGDHFKKIVNNL